MRSAIRPHRREGQFFLAPGEVAHRRYEALRAYFVEGETAAAVADRFGYTESTVATLVRTSGEGTGPSSSIAGRGRGSLRPRWPPGKRCSGSGRPGTR